MHFKQYFLYGNRAALLLAIGSAMADNNPVNLNPTYQNEIREIPRDYPSYQNGVLTIPRIDTPAQPGHFQYATFKYDGQGSWGLLGFRTANEHTLHYAHIEQVKLVITDSFPVQVFLNVFGWLSNGCESLGQINQRLVNNRFEVAVHAEDPSLLLDPQNAVACTQSIANFEKNIPLYVYDLSAGSYGYSINGGEHTGTFTLAKDNKFPLTDPKLIPCCKGDLPGIVNQ